MPQLSLRDVFQNYVTEKSIFKNKSILSIDFTPQNIPHREKQIKQLALILAPILRGEKPSNIFIYGKTGTGKTLCIKHVISNLLDSLKPNKKIKTIYINCKMRKVSDTEYRLLAQLIYFFGETVPYTGLPTDNLYKKFFQLLDSDSQNIIIVLDEIDTLVEKVGDDILYNLTRINQDLNKTKVTIIGISNRISFIEQLDPRVKSSLSEEEIIFPPYNANELRDILWGRAKFAFNPGCLEQAVIAKCAALAAQEHGDARKALDLLRVAAELAERERNIKVTEKEVDLAEKKLDRDRILEIVKIQPKQSQAVLFAILKLYNNGKKNIETGEVYDLYTKLCYQNGLNSLTQRRVSDLISELDTFGIVNATLISKGRYGRTRKINIHLPDKIVSTLEDSLTKEFS